ncbi:Oidioi.mRNA.OKI2018_I69.PAR.g10841.t1.cds [Oikopleura dioica]|uniref:Oidioi.mRNA.OKI2018_I69.PAR.g10841.t1.cds n=1 Tax=Oikopleura dioica TaxID=34765 RepID=A0ABN7RSZ7_OIKDI|nr:Oidioi.mRNA.OKI2018_I69.PAR.g10841.t1.cds [Oikopleura dioica]
MLLERRIQPELLVERSEQNSAPFESFSDVCNQNLTNVIRQLSCLAGHAEEILGEHAGELWVRNERIRKISVRVDALTEKIKSLNPKTSAQLQNTPRRVVSTPPFRSPSHVERRLFAIKSRPQSVVRLQRQRLF